MKNNKMQKVILNCDVAINELELDGFVLTDNKIEDIRVSVLQRVENFINTQESENYIRRLLVAQLIRGTDSIFETEVIEELARDIEMLVRDELREASDSALYIDGDVTYSLVDEEGDYGDKDNA